MSNKSAYLNRLESLMDYIGETDEGWEEFTDWAIPRIPRAWDVARATQTGPVLRSNKTMEDLGRALCITVESEMMEYAVYLMEQEGWQKDEQV